MKKLHLFLMFTLALLAIAGAILGPRLIRKFTAPEKKDHPGFIVSVENPGGKETIVDATDFPDRRKFVFIKDGQEVATKEEADTIIPITRIDIFKGPDNSILEIHEQGPEGQSLRRTYSK